MRGGKRNLFSAANPEKKEDEETYFIFVYAGTKY